ncbi:MAG: TonB-dependent receptor [Bacteroidetes bacterium]|nr:TonB-dependent receptor [Bacteroidota bacterium]
MKKRVLWLRYLILFFALASASIAYAQEITVSGKVTDATDGSLLPGVTIVVKNTTTGTVTDIDGKYSIKVKKDAVLVFSYVGYMSQEITVTEQRSIDISLSVGTKSLNEVVVIGYGTVKKQDATGSVAAISSKDFNQGNIQSPQQLIVGKIAGVQVTTTGGAPGGDAIIRIRGGSSINANNDPLLVVDGVAIDNASTSGARSTLGMLNPEDIETYTVLKDASATAIYGSRASNGVIIITTKKGVTGSKKFGLEYSGNVSISTVPKTISVYNGDDFRALVLQRYPNNPGVDTLLGKANTDWQKQIYRTAVGTDHNLAFTGAISTMPYRVSIGYNYQDGTLLTDNMRRTTLGATLNPTFFKNYLKVNINAKYMYEKNKFADQAAIGDAVAFDPTQEVYAYGNSAQTIPNSYGGFWAWLQPNGDPVRQATTNPVARLKLTDNTSSVNRFLGNAQFDYKLHFFPDLRVNLNLGMDYSWSKGNNYVPTYATWNYFNKGVDNNYDQTKKNSLLDFYLNYVKDVKSISSKFDVMAGYSWQHFWVNNNNYNGNVPHDSAHADTVIVKQEYYLVSFYGRFNYTFKNRYLLTATLRDDGSSRFSSSNRWGLFPSVALGWKINDEKFLRDSKVISQLKLRLGWGQTGQQDISSNWYPYIPIYTQSDRFSMYQFGNVWYRTLRPDAYDPNIKWETTSTWNVGIDLGFLKDRITASVDYFYKDTKDMLNFIPVPAGTNLSNYVWTNVGSMNNAGVEFTLDVKPIVTKDWNWDIGFNATTYKNKITKLNISDDPNYPGIMVGGISGGVGNTVQIDRVGSPINSFYVYQQVYDANGNPIEGLYVDRNGDGKITDADRYTYKSPNPTFTFGINTRLNYKKWSLAASGHANIGNYMYNNVEANRGVYANLYRPEGPYLGNVATSVTNTGFVNQQYLSDYYVQNASFFKLDYLTLAYNFGNLVKNTLNLGISFTVNNVFTITKYKGLDPEVNLGSTLGIDNNMYPRSRVYVIGVSLKL